MDMKKCSCCGEDIPIESKFCPYCRNDLSQELNCCPSCGKELPLESNFCPYCMERIGEPVDVSVSADKKVNKKFVAIIVLIFTIFLMCVVIFFAHYNKEVNDNNTDTNNDVLTEEANDDIEVESTENNVTDENNVDVTSDVNATPNKPNTESITTKEESKTTNTNTSSTSTTKSEKETTANNVVTQCAHNWVKQTKIVHHEEVGHYETIQKQRPVTRYKCPVCYKKYESVNEYYNHFDSTHKPGYSGDPIGALRNQYTTVTEYEYYNVQEWIVDREAYDETVVTGYKCKNCGKEKSA